ncbi:MAG: restriction endonuclease [Saprospiraceae bacterium]|nr:restriction endonuclease [Saprospiraceae bacterium]
MNYNFLILSPYEFEILTKDLLQKVFNVDFESFGSGKDGGIDLRYSKAGDTIVQCKRYKDYKSLLQNLNKEVPKVKILNPKKYIISTSASLLPAQKAKIKELFHPYIQNENQIYGREDLNNILSKNSDVEKKHYKLWLSSTTILQEIVNSQVINQSKFVQSEIFNKIGVYVQNDSFEEAIEILKVNKYVIISGNPGIGKTTLAEMIIYHLLAKDVEQFIYLSDSISKAFELYIEGKSQIFFFDDFLGRNFLQSKLPTNEEKQIIKFIQRIEKSKNKFLVFTTREYILNQATEKYEDFQLVEFSKCILDIGKYSKLVKAEILYNHFHINEMPFEYVQSLIMDDKLFEIINHQNYNPRIIKSFTKSKLWTKCSPKEFAKSVLDLFDNPYLVWEHTYETQISELSRYILLNLIISGSDIEYHTLYDQLKFYLIKNENEINITLNNYSFKSSLRELENSFISIFKKYELNLIIEFQNPSIQDFLVEHISKDTILKESLLKSIRFIKNAFTKINFSIEKKVDKKININDTELSLLTQHLIDNFNELKYDSKFTIYSRPNEIDNHILKLSTCYFQIREFDREFSIQQFEKIINSSRISYHSINDFCYLLENFYQEIEINPIELLSNLSTSFLSYDDLKSLDTLKYLFPSEFEEFKEENDEDYRDIFYYIVDDLKDEQFEEVYEYNDIIEKLYRIETDFEYDTYNERKIVEEKMEDIKTKIQEQETLDQEDDYYFRHINYLDHHDEDLRRESRKKTPMRDTGQVEKKTLSTDEIIINLFESLK